MLRQIVHASISARLFIDGPGNLQRSRQLRGAVDQCLDGDDGRREAALHVAGAPAIDPAVPYVSGERVDGPAAAALYDIDVAVEMHTRPRRGALAARNDIDARVALAVAGSARRVHILHGEAAGAQAFADELRAASIGLA